MLCVPGDGEYVASLLPKEQANELTSCGFNACLSVGSNIRTLSAVKWVLFSVGSLCSHKTKDELTWCLTIAQECSDRPNGVWRRLRQIIFSKPEVLRTLPLLISFKRKMQYLCGTERNERDLTWLELGTEIKLAEIKVWLGPGILIILCLFTH